MRLTRFQSWCVAAATLALLFGGAALGAHGQGRRASPIQSFPTVEPDPEQPSQQNNNALKTETIIVPVRVVVRDAEGHAVINLTRSDFKLFQDGKPQDIINFVGVANTANFPATANAAAPEATPAANSTAAIVATPAVPTRFVALFFDDVHLGLQDLMRARTAADQYVKSSLEPADRVAVYTVSGQSQLDFTTDRDALHKTLEAVLPHAAAAGESSNPGDCPPMDFAEADAIANQDSAQVLNIATNDALACAYNNEDEFRQRAREMATRTAEQLVSAADQEAEASFRRIREVVRRISVVPGDRDVVLISPGFIYPGHEIELAEIIDKAIHANVVINTLDARGLYAPGASDITQSGRAHGSPISTGILDTYRMAAENLQNNVLVELADSTGGLSFKDNNDLNAGFRKTAAAPEMYYLLAYSPRNLKTDGHYHNLKVTLAAKQNVTIEARHGFYAPSRTETAAQAAKREIDDALFSDGEQRDLPVGLQTRVEKTASGDKQLDVIADLDIAHLHFQKANGVNQEGLTLVAALFDNDGNYVDGTQKVLNLNLRDATLADLSKTGASSELDFKVKGGVYFLRLVVRDTNDQHIYAQNATVDVPD
ncbi:MAG TPA: VWA domain-containing protein [Candidatus Acidoferrum sp.]|jgi:VWFA-related protein|nr:VWA domain-containing protein [Candidatus Acidoferrum sp.]